MSQNTDSPVKRYKRRKRSKLRETLILLMRSYTPFSALLFFGKLLQKRALRTLSIAAIATWGVAWQSVQVVASPEMSDMLQRILPHVETALITVALLFPLGIMITGVFNLIALRYEQKARLNLALTADYKKTTLVKPFLAMLWEQVYSNERLYDSNIPNLTTEQFVQQAHQAINTAQPQALQEQAFGFPLTLAETWSRVGIFTVYDHLGDLLAYHQAIRQLKEVSSNRWLRLVKEMLVGEPGASFWHSLTIRKMKLQIGRALREMNATYQGGTHGPYVYAEHFVWPDDRILVETASHFPEVDSRDPIIAAILDERRRIIQSTFASNPVEAREHVWRVWNKDYLEATRLRLQFDPWFANSNEFQNQIERMERLAGKRIFSKRFLRRVRRRAKRSMQQAEAYSVMIDGLDQLILRTVHIACHIDFKGIGTAMRKKKDACSDEHLHLVGDEPMLTRGLRKVREMQILSVHQLDMYAELVIELGQYESE